MRDDFKSRFRNTFTVPLADVIAANERYLQHVERTHAGLIALYASLPRSTQPRFE